MRTTLMLAATLALGASVMAPTLASASVEGCRNTGTGVGAVGGAVVGNAIGGGKIGGTLLGGLAGAAVGHEVAVHNCNRPREYCHWERRSRHGHYYRVKVCHR